MTTQLITFVMDWEGKTIHSAGNFGSDSPENSLKIGDTVEFDFFGGIGQTAKVIDIQDYDCLSTPTKMICGKIIRLRHYYSVEI